MTTPEAVRVEEIRARRQRLSSALDDGGDEQALVGGDIDWLLAALTTQAETIRRLADGFEAERHLRRIKEACLESAEKEVDELKETIRRLEGEVADLRHQLNWTMQDRNIGTELLRKSEQRAEAAEGRVGELEALVAHYARNGCDGGEEGLRPATGEGA